jgi:hypothetical protein
MIAARTSGDSSSLSRMRSQRSSLASTERAATIAWRTRTDGWSTR